MDAGIPLLVSTETAITYGIACSCSVSGLVVTRRNCLISCVADVDALWTNAEVLAVATTLSQTGSGKDLLSYNAINDRTGNPSVLETLRSG